MSDNRPKASRSAICKVVAMKRKLKFDPTTRITQNLWADHLADARIKAPASAHDAHENSLSAMATNQVRIISLRLMEQTWKQTCDEGKYGGDGGQ